jgi:hypothetical protein
VALFSRPNSSRSFDTAKLELPSGQIQQLTREEFDAMPLDQRVRALLSKNLKFYKDGVQVASKEALAGR